ncbi:Bd3614 family nucleic acid deaminase [Myxococcus sp. CA056]|uniref:Bd3614 family nucleic acid deaminase n=1 Tax=Myxococcus sp. CA056 TaxID=2741740 RepID=UPI00157BA156|nr:Bd3614 family nucleic acid deaminase [Myxococcus sp. CA056]NTX15735.1 Bd3614 family nucleic acid deaminase [Myxococcus sp. CA056]
MSHQALAHRIAELTGMARFAFCVIDGPLTYKLKRYDALVCYSTGIEGNLPVPPIVALQMAFRGGLTHIHVPSGYRQTRWEMGTLKFLKRAAEEVKLLEGDVTRYLLIAFPMAGSDWTLINFLKAEPRKLSTMERAGITNYQPLGRFRAPAPDSIVGPSLNLRKPGAWDATAIRAHRFYMMLAFSLLHHRGELLQGLVVFAQEGKGQSVGAVLVDGTGKILSWSVNTAYDNACFHAEVNLLHAYLGRHQQLPDGFAILYTTLQPCHMCAGLIAGLIEQGHELQVVYGEHDTHYSGGRTVLDEKNAQLYLNSTEKYSGGKPKAVRLPKSFAPTSSRYMPDELEKSFSKAGEQEVHSRLVYLLGRKGQEKIVFDEKGYYPGPVLIEQAWEALKLKLRKYLDREFDDTDLFEVRQNLSQLSRYLSQWLTHMGLREPQPQRTVTSTRSTSNWDEGKLQHFTAPAFLHATNLREDDAEMLPFEFPSPPPQPSIIPSPSDLNNGPFSFLSVFPQPAPSQGIPRFSSRPEQEEKKKASAIFLDVTADDEEAFPLRRGNTPQPRAASLILDITSDDEAGFPPPRKDPPRQRASTLILDIAGDDEEVAPPASGLTKPSKLKRSLEEMNGPPNIFGQQPSKQHTTNPVEKKRRVEHPAPRAQTNTQPSFPLMDSGQPYTTVEMMRVHLTRTKQRTVRPPGKAPKALVYHVGNCPKMSLVRYTLQSEQGLKALQYGDAKGFNACPHCTR